MPDGGGCDASDLELDREIAKRGLYEFVKIAWPHVEPTEYVDSWHIGALCSVFEDVSFGIRRRVVINVPPGSTKSLLSNVFWPAWDAICINPARRWMFVSFDASLLNLQSQKLIQLWCSPWFVERWGAFLKTGKPNTSEIISSRGGMKFNTSFGGRGTGRHSDIQVIDDPIKPKDANGGPAITGVVLESTWQGLSHTFGSRARDPKTFARVMIQQRVHEDDPSARALADGWEHVCFPMLYESERADPLDQRTTDGECLSSLRWPEEEIARLQRDAIVWATQYQQRPTVPGGQIVESEWISGNACTMADARAQRGMLVQSWDLSFKDAESSDWVAGGWWCVTYEPARDALGNATSGVESHYWLLDCIHRRLSFTATCNEILSRVKLWPSSKVLIEDKANGPACENTLRERVPRNLLELVNPLGSKVGRVQAVAPEFANGQVHIPSDAPWYTAYKQIIERFPRVRRDDPADQTSQAILWLRKGGSWTSAMSRIKARSAGGAPVGRLLIPSAR